MGRPSGVVEEEAGEEKEGSEVSMWALGVLSVILTTGVVLILGELSDLLTTGVVLILGELSDLKKLLREIRDELTEANSSQSELLNVQHGVLEGLEKTRRV